MLTYTVPFFGFQNDTYFFKWVATHHTHEML
jgi:hypothetical protein